MLSILEKKKKTKTKTKITKKLQTKPLKSQQSLQWTITIISKSTLPV